LARPRLRCPTAGAGRTSLQGGRLILDFGPGMAIGEGVGNPSPPGASAPICSRGGPAAGIRLSWAGANGQSQGAQRDSCLVASAVLREPASGRVFADQGARSSPAPFGRSLPARAACSGILPGARGGCFIVRGRPGLVWAPWGWWPYRSPRPLGRAARGRPPMWGGVFGWGVVVGGQRGHSAPGGRPF